MHNNSHLQALLVNDRIQSYMREAEMSRLAPVDTASRRSTRRLASLASSLFIQRRTAWATLRTILSI